MGVEEELLLRVFDESQKFFSLPLEEKMKLATKHHRGYTPMYAENLDYSSSSRGDSKESFYIGSLEAGRSYLNRWPSEEILPSWRPTMESYHKKLLLGAKSGFICLDNIVNNVYKVLLLKDGKYGQTQLAGSRVWSVGKKLISLIAQALDLDADFFEKVGALDDPMPFLRLLHYPGDLEFCGEETYGASAHSDYGMVTLLATNGVPGLQACLMLTNQDPQL
ncbi:hypothetical protein CK203_009163 [Vitis vinifera]|uniref:Non-haem dioxygenase N-terminal domain-containing protein n=1 Tax=Vitis vinifera TaxID=29760 RepID=A0A438K2Z7_VITVI|nr:hypothetical protein CK203_009163 [Vitis vinifera]